MTASVPNILATLQAGPQNLTLIDQNFAALVTAINAISPIAPLPRSYLAGMGLSNDGTLPNSVLDIAQGQCTDSTNSTNIVFGSTITKSTAGTWAAGTGANGMGVGLTVAPSTWYHVFPIINLGAPDVYFDTSVSAANKPPNTTAFRRIGSFKTDGSSHILTFIQEGDQFLWATSVPDVNAATIGTAAALETLGSVPPGVKVQALYRAFITNATGSVVVLLTSPDENDQAPGAGLGDIQGTGAAVPAYGPISTRTNTSQQIRVRASVNSTTLDVFTYGYVDSRGRSA